MFLQGRDDRLGQLGRTGTIIRNHCHLAHVIGDFQGNIKIIGFIFHTTPRSLPDVPARPPNEKRSPWKDAPRSPVVPRRYHTRIFFRVSKPEAMIPCRKQAFYPRPARINFHYCKASISPPRNDVPERQKAPSVLS